MRVAVASDHGGFIQKADICAYIESLGYEVEDLGPATDDRCDYPDYAEKVCDYVVSGKADRGILICGTGIGMSIAANKIDGIRAAEITTPDFARLCREHNNANVMCLSGRFVDLPVNEENVKVFLETDFEGGRHAERVEKIMALQNK